VTSCEILRATMPAEGEKRPEKCSTSSNRQARASHNGEGPPMLGNPPGAKFKIGREISEADATGILMRIQVGRSTHKGKIQNRLRGPETGLKKLKYVKKGGKVSVETQ